MKVKKNFILRIKNQDEYTLARNLCKKLGIRCGFDGGVELYCFNVKDKTLQVGHYKDYLKVKNKQFKGYDFYKASEYFKNELKTINDKFCCKEFRTKLQVKEDIIFKGKYFYIKHHTGVIGFKLTYCPFCGKKIEVEE